MAQNSIMLPDVSVENFEHAWKRFHLAAVVKQWQEEKQLQINFADIVAWQHCELLHGPWRR